MNVKVHTPESLKKGSGMASWKQFLLSILATTVSIVLTFGTSGIINHKKKQSAKRQIVMMVMYDMYGSLTSVEKADSSIRQSMDFQRQLAEDPTRFETLRYQMALFMPRVDFTETTERIFSSSIETINTVGNVLFTENVATFYQMRQVYKTTVSAPVYNDVVQNESFSTIKGILDFNYSEYALTSCSILTDMRHLYAQCRKMMKVTDEEIETYRKARAQIEESVSEGNEGSDAIFEIIDLQSRINESKARLKRE